MDKLLSAIQLYVSLLKDLVTIVSLSVGVFVAVRGINTWRHQLMGTADFDLAKRLLTATYRLRNALESVRNPLITAEEFANAIKETHLDIKPEDPNFRAASTASVYEIRWRPVVEAYQAIELEAVEAEAIWDKEARTATSTIRKSVITLYNALGQVLEDMQSQTTPFPDKQSLEANRRIVFSMALEPDKDPFLKELNPAINAIEDLARPHLVR
jgi:hypothetical protein